MSHDLRIYNSSHHLKLCLPCYVMYKDWVADKDSIDILLLQSSKLLSLCVDLNYIYCELHARRHPVLTGLLTGKFSVKDGNEYVRLYHVQEKIK